MQNNRCAINKGFTIIELLIVIAILAILSGIILVIVNPTQYFQRGRDTKRMSHLNALVEAIQEYHLDNGVYPDEPNTLRQSHILTGTNTSLVDSSGSWIDADLSKYLSKMFIDPINNETYHFRYQHNSVGFEIDVAMENYTDKHANSDDGGNNENRLELGNDLTILN